MRSHCFIPDGKLDMTQRRLIAALAMAVSWSLLANSAARVETFAADENRTPGQSARVFPGKSWQQASPSSQGVDEAKLKTAVDDLAEGFRDWGGIDKLVIVRHGRLIWKGPKSDESIQVYSVTKSFTSTALGLLIDDKKVTLETLAKDFEPRLAEHYPAVTLRHFATMTSGYDAVGGGYERDQQGRIDGDRRPETPPDTPLFPPGARFRYWDDAMTQFGHVLTRAAGEPLDQLVRRRIGEPIGMANWQWAEVGSSKGKALDWPGGIHTSASELARFGLLYLNRGNWDGRQLISADWVDQATTVQVPPSVPNDALPRSRGAGVYGYNWWVNGIKPNGKRLWPGAPPKTYIALGLNTNVCIVIPEWDMVISRTNGHTADKRVSTPPNVDGIWSGFFGKLSEAVDSDGG